MLVRCLGASRTGLHRKLGCTCCWHHSCTVWLLGNIVCIYRFRTAHSSPPTAPALICRLCIHCRASFDGRHTMRLPRGSAIRCTTSKCALPMVSLGYLDRDW